MSLTLTNMAMFGIVIGFMFLVWGFLMEGPQTNVDPSWDRTKGLRKKSKKRASRVTHLHKKAA